MRVFLGIVRLLLLVVMSAVVIVVHFAYRVVGKSWSFPKGIYGLLTLLFGFPPNVVGRDAGGQGRPVFYAANHVSYLDVIAIGSVIDGWFVAKSEVADWPLFGMLAKIQRTVFIRRVRTAIDAGKDAVAEILRSGRSAVIFAEGTSTDGANVKPFKPGLFDALYESGVDALVQPVAVVLDTVEGKKVGSDAVLRDRYAWWRPEHTLVPHLWAFACTVRTGVTLHFLPPLDPRDYPDRKALAMAAQKAVQAAVEAGAGMR